MYIEISQSLGGKSHMCSWAEFVREKKIILATESFMTKFPESTIRDKLSKAVADYIIAMKREINPRLNYIRYISFFIWTNE